jgi:predicted phosphoadenosine phosphosulfate sulfurtransferase
MYPFKVARFVLVQVTKFSLSRYIGIPNANKVYKMGKKYSKLPRNTPTFSIPRLSKMYPIWDFWNENIPSGNPGPLYLMNSCNSCS